MSARRVLGATIVALPLLYLLAVNLSQLDRLGTDAGLQPLSAGDAWGKAALHLLVFLVVPIVGVLVAVGPEALGAAGRTAFGSALPRPAAFRLTAGLGLGVLVAILAVASWSRGRDGGLFAMETSRTAFSTLPFHAAVALSAAAAFAEEVLFRGILLRGLRQRLGATTAIAAQAVVFGAIHIAYGSPFHALVATVFGVVLAVVALRAGLWVSMIVHFEANALLLASWSDAQPVWPVVLGALVGAVALLALARGNERTRASVENGTDAPSNVPLAASA